MADDEKIAELTAIIQTVRDRVRSRYPEPQSQTSNTMDSFPRIQIPIADLMPLVHARDAAQAKIAAIGSVNPRAGGLANKIIQFVKKSVARAFQWFVRDQVTFNRETISAVEAVMEALNEHNRILISLASQTNEHIGLVRGEMAARVQELSRQIDVRAVELTARNDEQFASLRDLLEPVIEQVDLLRAETVELKDVRRHWIEWRFEWEKKLATNEIQFLRSAADLQGAFQHRVSQIESNFRDIAKGQHTDYLGALDRSTLDIQKRLWQDLEKIRADYERLIHTELRLIRQRAPVPVAIPVAAAAPALPSQTVSELDYTRFAERFRGSEDYVRRNQAFYKPVFAGCGNVLDIGCGRGEFLETMRDIGIAAKGIDLGEESVAQCRAKGFDAQVADLFEYLAAQPDGEFDGIMSSQVVEHLPPDRLPEMIRLCAAKLRRGGVLALETPNPECLAIFATHFYLDPTHTRPVPQQLLGFYMEESGLGQIQYHSLSPAIETMPELAELPQNFRNRFFGGLDFAITGRKL